jgi:hypothetical protein
MTQMNASASRTIVQIVGVTAAILFLLVGVSFDLQLFADGSIFSYGIAAQDAWDFHWHNISTRMTVYLYAHVPSETYVALTDDARGGIVLYGVLFFSAPLLGLIATRACDHSSNRTFFTAACLSTACLCPLVFGFPTEMWIGHSIYWPTLALAFSPTRRPQTTLALTVSFPALMLTHEAGVVFAFAIVCFLALRGLSDPLFRQSLTVFLIALILWAIIRYVLPPDAYYAAIIKRGAFTLFDVNNLILDSGGLLPVILMGYGGLVLAGGIWRDKLKFQRFPHELIAAFVVAGGLCIYWIWFDQSLQAVSRYPIRTVLLIAIPLLGGRAAIHEMVGNGDLKLFAPQLPKLIALADRKLHIPAAAGMGALFLVSLVHVVQTSKFVSAWQVYVVAVRQLAKSDPASPNPTATRPAKHAKPPRELSDSRMISSEHIDDDVNRPSWHSTTQYLSVLVAPGFLPRRLVADPDAGYFWLSCSLAKRSENAPRAIPMPSRTLIRIHACLNRPE